MAFDLPLALGPIRTRRRVSPLDAAFSLVADLILGDAGIAARPAVDALRRLLLGGWLVAQTGSHALLARVTGHVFCLRIAVCRSLLLRVDQALVSPKGEARWRRGPPNEGSELDRLCSHLRSA